MYSPSRFVARINEVPRKPNQFLILALFGLQSVHEIGTFIKSIKSNPQSISRINQDLEAIAALFKSDQQTYRNRILILSILRTLEQNGNTQV